MENLKRDQKLRTLESAFLGQTRKLKNFTRVFLVEKYSRKQTQKVRKGQVGKIWAENWRGEKLKKYFWVNISGGKAKNEEVKNP